MFLVTHRNVCNCLELFCVFLRLFISAGKLGLF